MHRGLERHLAPCGIGKATIKAVTTVASYHRCITYTKRQNQQDDGKQMRLYMSRSKWANITTTSCTGCSRSLSPFLPL